MAIELYQLDGLQLSGVIFAFVSEFAWHIEIKSFTALTSEQFWAFVSGLPVINSCRLMHAAIALSKIDFFSYVIISTIFSIIEFW